MADCKEIHGQGNPRNAMTKHSFTLRDAELAYKTFGCSHFFMYREEPELHVPIRR